MGLHNTDNCKPVDLYALENNLIRLLLFAKPNFFDKIFKKGLTKQGSTCNIIVG